MMQKNKLRVGFLLFLPLLLFLTFFFNNQKSYALSGSEFDPGYIIDDSVFYDFGTMSVAQIQQFLDAKVPVCATNHPSSNPSYQPPFTCLKNFRQDTVNKPPESGLCSGNSASNRSAAEIIYDVARSCGINPQVLIVLLQKEQSLITDDWPWSIQYRSATGYGCPDTAPCDAQYYGFFNQVYEAARAFKRYALNPVSYNYRYGRNNFILYNPNTACGGSNVFIQNQATASLYIYTPYQPNSSALANLYGSGDGCGAYGNRNFWRMFNDWFGSTRGSYLLRSVQDATVYMVSEDTKYPISNLNILSALYPLGTIKYVSQEFLNSKTTGPLVGRLLRATDGTIYYFDAGIKLAFGSCALVADYGYSCGSYASLTDVMLSKFVGGPAMTKVFGTTSGKNFFITGGTKREIYDDLSKQQSSITDYANVLNESAISNLTYGLPVIRDGVLVQPRGFADVYVYQQSQKNPITGSVYGETALANNLTRSFLDPASLNPIPTGSVLNGFIKNITNTQFYVLDKTGKALLSSPSEWSSNYTSFSDVLLNQIANSSQPINNKIVKTADEGTVYLVDSNQKRPFYEWIDLVNLKPSPFIINNISKTTMNAMSDGNRILGPGRLVKYPSSGTVYVVENNNTLIPVTTFAVPQNLGLDMTVITVPSSVLDNYTKKTSAQSIAVTCSSKNYIASNGNLREVLPATQANYQISYMAIDNSLCLNMGPASSPSTDFIRVSDGTIYKVENGLKRGISSFQAYINVGGNQSNTTQLSDFSAGVFPNGININ